MTDTPIHPSLQPQLIAHRRRSRRMSLAIFLTIAGAMIFAMTTALQGNTLGDLLQLAMIGGIALLMVVLCGGLMWGLDHFTMRRLMEKNRQLQEQNSPGENPPC
ncbi:MAG TPA: hypothetical protein DCS21_08990 [Gammaproteobacteria bacterium]|nr:hypothetical protein [Gammaproteobacteria bacterium]